MLQLLLGYAQVLGQTGVCKLHRLLEHPLKDEKPLATQGLELLKDQKMEKTKFEIGYQYYMVVIGVVGQMVFYAQAYKIFEARSARDVSLLGFTFGFISVASWLVYGLIKRDQPLIIANIVAVIGAMSVLTGIGMYG